MHYRNLDELKSFRSLSALNRPVALRRTLNSSRIDEYSAPMGGGLAYNYAAKQVDQAVLEVLSELAREQELIQKYQAVLDGEIMNSGERRMVLHHLARGRLGAEVRHSGRNLADFYEGERQRVAGFADAVRSGDLRGSTGKPFDTAVQIGIGGSDLGPRALYHALCAGTPAALRAEFISNVDPDDAAAVLSRIDPETTLFILVSKSGTTQETLANEAFVLERIARCPAAGMKPKKHIVAVTSETSPLAASGDYLASFHIDDFIGGRYSATSAVGGVLLGLAFGPQIFAEVLAGAHESDAAAMEPDVRKNAALLDALIGVYERNVLGYGVSAVLPYSQALIRFPAHLQQLDMESNGKRVNRHGQPLRYPTGPVIFGEPGTNGQHSFYQLLHQGTDIIPVQFIGFRASQRGEDVLFQGSTGQAKLNANLAAQIAAFARGQSSSDSNKDFPGERPSSLIHGPRLTPRALGALLAHFENKVMFQGFIWNINSFDQEGVQLGKRLADTILAGTGTDEVLSAYAGLLGL